MARKKKRSGKEPMNEVAINRERLLEVQKFWTSENREGAAPLPIDRPADGDP